MSHRRGALGVIPRMIQWALEHPPGRWVVFPSVAERAIAGLVRQWRSTDDREALEEASRLLVAYLKAWPDTSEVISAVRHWRLRIEGWAAKVSDGVAAKNVTLSIGGVPVVTRRPRIHRP